MRSTEYLHIIAFDIPLPANYGGVIDIWYKIKALSEAGVKIILHAYQYGRENSDELEKACHKVYLYKRKTFRNPLYGRLPYIIASRNSSELLENLLKDSHPILFEGLHCCYYLNHPLLESRFKIVRTHNIEHDYYRNLEIVEPNFFKKYFFRIEAERLKKFQGELENAGVIAAISQKDANYFSRRFKNVIYLPPFHPNFEVRSREGRGEFVLYHGNLAVGENYMAAMFLVNEVFSHLDIPLIIAGSRPPRQLVKAVASYSHISIRDDLNSAEMLKLVEEAHINVLPTFQDTGIKLKLINALYRGRHCVANKKMIHGTGLENLCHKSNTADQFINTLKRLWERPFAIKDINTRRQMLEQKFSNRRGAMLLISQFSEIKPERVSEPAFQPE